MSELGLEEFRVESQKLHSAAKTATDPMELCQNASNTAQRLMHAACGFCPGGNEVRVVKFWVL